MSVYSGFVHPSELITRINDAHTRLEQAQEHSEVVRLSTLQIELANAEQEATRLVGQDGEDIDTTSGAIG
jgi:hypothetical protein